MDQKTPETSSGRKVGPNKSSFTLSIEPTEILYDPESIITQQRNTIAGMTSLTSGKSRNLKILRRNTTTYRTDNPNLKQTLQKLPRNTSLKEKFVEIVPDYVSLWPRSEIIACYFQFLALLASVLVVEYATFNLIDGLATGLSESSLAGDRLTRIILIVQAVVFGIGVVIRVAWPSKREELTAAAMQAVLEY